MQPGDNVQQPQRVEVRILTPIAAGAIAVVQVSGPRSPAIAAKVFRPRRGSTAMEVPAGQVVYGEFVDAAGLVFDDGLMVRGDEWVEFNLHGGVRIVQRLVQQVQQQGAVLADPGQPAADRGFDWLPPLERWLQRCLQEAATARVVQWLAGQPGLWRAQLAEWQDRIRLGDLEGVLCEAEDLATQAPTLGQAWRGRTIAIVGPPNAGKSTLANRLAGRSISLVADAPGTTRDWIGEPIAIQGWPVTIVDTAGLRASDDPVEAEGVARALVQAVQADVRVLVLDGSAAAGGVSEMRLDRAGLRPYDIVAYNKCDLPCRRPADDREAWHAPTREVNVSCLTGQGWSELEQAVVAACGFTALQEQKPLVFCAELLDRLDHLTSVLRSRQAAEALTTLESLEGREIRGNRYSGSS